MRRFSPGLIGSVMPSPANVSSSSTLKLPPSRVSSLELVTHSARSGRADPRDAFQSDTFSAYMCLDDGHQCGFVFVNCDAVFQFVFEEVAEVVAFRGADHLLARCGNRAIANCAARGR